MYDIRRATKDDKDGIIEISSQIWEGYDYVPHVVDKWIEDETGEFTVVESEGRVAGFVKTDLLREGEYWLQGIRVHPDFRGKGFGKVMTEYLIDNLKVKGYRSIELSTFVENYESLHIIEKYGFRKKADFKFFYTDEKRKIEGVRDYEPAASFDEIKGILDSKEMKAAKGYLSFDWVFVRADEELLKKLFDRKEIYVLREEGEVKSIIVLSEYMDKVDYIFLSYAGGKEHYKDAVEFAINEFSVGDHGILGFMAPDVDGLAEAAELAGMKKDSDAKLDAFVYEYKG